MAGQNKKDPQNDQTGKHVTQVFGDPENVMDDLVQGSLALQSLPGDLQGKLIGAIDQLPEKKQIKAIQALQKEKSVYLDVATQNRNAGEKAFAKLNELKNQYTKKKQQLLEEHERKKEHEHAEQLLNDE